MESLPVAHFETVCGFVEETYADLLSKREQQWLQSLASLELDAKILYVRLLARRFNTFRLSKLDYAELVDLPKAVSALCDASLATTDAPRTATEICKLFTKPELLAIADRGDLKNRHKADLIDALFENNPDLALQQLQAADQWITVGGHDVFSWFLLCFFGNRYQDTTEFVISELGHIKYYPYVIDQSTRLFTSREQIDAHLQCYECDTTYEQIDKRDVHALLTLDSTLPPHQHHDAALTRRIDRARLKIARQLERLNNSDDAIALYQQCNRAPARERIVRLHQKAGRYELAWRQLDTIAQTPLCDEEMQFVDMFRPRLARQMDKKWASHVYKPIASKLVLKPHATQRVEVVARDFYQQSGDCHYLENTLFNGVLGLLIWDQVFTSLPGAFSNPFQSAPVDFYDPGFYQRRATELDACLEAVTSADFPHIIQSRFNQHKGYANPLMRWEYLDEMLLAKALDVIPALHWRACFERQLQDLRHNTSGFPDLIYFPDSGGYELIEIKGPGDAVQKNQKRWYAYFESVGIPYRVVQVKWANPPVDSL